LCQRVEISGEEGGESLKKVITYGSFDLFHRGHYNLLKRAKALGDYLIVGVTTEQYDKSRGKLNVCDSLSERIESVRKTGFADEIIVEDHIGQKVEDILKYHVDILTVGSDWIGEFDHMRKYCEVVYLERTKDISSTMLRTNNLNLVRLGIVGSGGIAMRFMPEIKYVSGIVPVGVFNPHVEGAKNFAEKFELKFYEDDWEAFLSKVDAVYIASPHGTHMDYTMRALNGGKHVLCEKPFAFSRQEAESAYALAKEKGLVLMEAVKTAYCPGFNQLVGVVQSGIIGTVYDVEACFTKLVPPPSREWAGEYAGAFFELASYPLLGIIKIFGTNYESVRFESFCNEQNTDFYTKAYIKYPNATATAKVGIDVKSLGSMVISGTRGFIEVKAPWWKTTEFGVHYEDPQNDEVFFSRYLGDGLRYEINEFLRAILGHDSNYFPAAESVAMASILEKFKEDKERCFK